MHAVDFEALRLLRRQDYDRLVEAGAFENERVELINGLILNMSPQKPEHAFPLRKLMRLLPRALEGGGFTLQVQSPFVAGDYSEPEPDLAAVPDLDYSHRHPDEAGLIVEVSNGAKALQQDLVEMAAVYAGSKVQEYWVVDVTSRCIWVHRQPGQGRWGSITRAGQGERVVVPRTAQSIDVAEILPRP